MFLPWCSIAAVFKGAGRVGAALRTQSWLRWGSPALCGGTDGGWEPSVTGSSALCAARPWLHSHGHTVPSQSCPVTVTPSYGVTRKIHLGARTTSSLPSCSYRAGSGAATITSNQNNPHSPLLPTAGSPAVSGSEETATCLSRGSFPSYEGRTGRHVNSHEQRSATHKAPLWGRRLPRRLSRGKGGPGVASPYRVRGGLSLCDLPQALSRDGASQPSGLWFQSQGLSALPIRGFRAPLLLCQDRDYPYVSFTGSHSDFSASHQATIRVACCHTPSKGISLSYGAVIAGSPIPPLAWASDCRFRQDLACNQYFRW